jgi:DNA-3-methyladenine glycosylase
MPSPQEKRLLKTVALSLPTSNPLSRSFFERPTLDVARALLGKTLIFQNYRGIITETEAYVGEDDPACHAARGRTQRTEVMYGPAGHAYVYFIYGMYHCFNVVTEGTGFPAAVLVRGLQIVGAEPSLHLDGPGKLCRHLGMTRAHSGIDMMTTADFCFLDEGYVPTAITQTPRIGIRVGLDKPWRFVAAQH